ncbi:MAG: hypothetical protein EA398_06695 [Deltaproteobacteria bacterium]|nr:MAG: hypothetical protein EA398_06695 [Deltaproteobacteria bacterium]
MSNAADVLRSVYGEASLGRLASAHGLDGDPYEALAGLFGDRKVRSRIVAALSEQERQLLAFAHQIGRRLRGDRLKKRWVLHGYDGFEDLIMPLVDQGLVIVGNTQAREPVALEHALENGIMQQWLQVTPGFGELAGDPPERREVVEGVTDETTPTLRRRPLVVEFNLLSLCKFIERHAIRLNRDGSPHRSDLKALAPWIIDRPIGSDRPDTTPDPLRADGWDVMIFLLSLAEGLGLIRRQGETLRIGKDPASYFQKEMAQRVPLLFRAFEQMRAWSELDAAEWSTDDEAPATGQGHGGFPENGGHGAALAGCRSTVLAGLRRLHLNDWFDIDETVETIFGLERGYLESSLPNGDGGEPEVRRFIEAFITIALPHLGAVELGTGSNGQRRARFTPFGATQLGGDCPEPASGRGALIVEPSFELTCFIDQATLPLLYDLSRFAEVVDTSERVVRYRIDGESAQYAYARGYTAERIIGVLEESSEREVPPAVRFALDDWERLHRRVTVFVHGDIIAAGEKTDPEVVQSGVRFAVDREGDIESIDIEHTFVSSGHGDALDRALTAHAPRVIDYCGPIVPTLRWVDDVRVLAPIGGTDLRTLARLQRLAIDEGDGVHRIDPDTILQHFPEGDGYAYLVQVLRDGLASGLSAERELTLKELLGQAVTGTIDDMKVLLVESDEDGERVARVADLDGCIEARLGPRAFHVKPDCIGRVVDVLDRLGVRIEDRTP